MKKEREKENFFVRGPVSLVMRRSAKDADGSILLLPYFLEGSKGFLIGGEGCEETQKTKEIPSRIFLIH